MHLRLCGWSVVLLAGSLWAEEPKLLAKPDAFRTLVNPDCSHCVDEAKSRADELLESDPVLAWTRGKYDGGAIPIRFFLNPYRVISDTYGVFVFDPDAGFARGYEPSLDFTFHGWRNGIVVMKHKDGTLFSTLSGRAFAGPRKGEQLKPVATLTTTWGYWKTAFPGSVAYRMFEKYQPTELPTDSNADSVSTRGKVDSRLPAETRVLGVNLGDVQKAYPTDSFAEGGGVVRDVIAGQEIAILWQSETNTAAAYDPVIEGADPPIAVHLIFDNEDPSAPFLDPKTGSRFGVEGRAVTGPLKGKSLRWIDSVQCRWFAWAAEFPQTEMDDRTVERSTPKIGPSIAEMILVDPREVNGSTIKGWEEEGFGGVIMPLDEEHAAADYSASASAVQSAGLSVHYWIEVARQRGMADAHPRWMASLGMHPDWRTRFRDIPVPTDREVAKAYPWVPITTREAFEAHRQRIESLLSKVPATYDGLLLNDLQGGPSSCGCGNSQCRWATDYGVASTASVDRPEDAAGRFIMAIQSLVEGKQIIPVWMTECESADLPVGQAPFGRSTGLCGSVPCARGACPKEFQKQLGHLMQVHAGPLGLLAAADACGRDLSYYRHPSEWIDSAVRYLDQTAASSVDDGIPHDRLWLVIQGSTEELELAARTQARLARPEAIITCRVPLDQTYEPRIVSLD